MNCQRFATRLSKRWPSEISYLTELPYSLVISNAGTPPSEFIVMLFFAE